MTPAGLVQATTFGWAACPAGWGEWGGGGRRRGQCTMIVSGRGCRPPGWVCRWPGRATTYVNEQRRVMGRGRIKQLTRRTSRRSTRSCRWLVAAARSMQRRHRIVSQSSPRGAAHRHRRAGASVADEKRAAWSAWKPPLPLVDLCLCWTRGERQVGPIGLCAVRGSGSAWSTLGRLWFVCFCRCWWGSGPPRPVVDAWVVAARDVSEPQPGGCGRPAGAGRGPGVAGRAWTKQAQAAGNPHGGAGVGLAASAPLLSWRRVGRGARGNYAGALGDRPLARPAQSIGPQVVPGPVRVRGPAPRRGDQPGRQRARCAGR